MNSVERIRVKLARARLHQQDLERQAQAFLSAGPYQVATRIDPGTRRLVYFLAAVWDTPIEMASVAGDVLQNLRSTLDHLTFELFMRATLGNAGDGKHISFPIFEDAKGYADYSPSKLKGVAANAVTAIDALKPYKGGNNVLWQIHRLNNIDKHRFLIAVGSAFSSLDLGAHMGQMMADQFPDLANAPFPSAFFRPADRMFPLKPGYELFLDGPDAKPNPKMQFRFELAFGESGIIEGEPLVETLQIMIGTVDGIIKGFETFLI